MLRERLILEIVRREELENKTQVIFLPHPNHLNNKFSHTRYLISLKCKPQSDTSEKVKHTLLFRKFRDISREKKHARLLISLIETLRANER